MEEEQVPKRLAAIEVYKWLHILKYALIVLMVSGLILPLLNAFAFMVYAFGYLVICAASLFFLNRTRQEMLRLKEAYKIDDKNIKVV